MGAIFKKSFMLNQYNLNEKGRRRHPDNANQGGYFFSSPFKMRCLGALSAPSGDDSGAVIPPTPLRSNLPIPIGRLYNHYITYDKVCQALYNN